MTALFLFLSLLGAGVTCYLVGRQRNRPPTVESWRGFLATDSARLLAALELLTATDRAMCVDLLRRATLARDSGLLAQSIRLVDLACSLLGSAVDDRTDRLRGMTLCLRMMSAVEPIRPLEARDIKVPSTRGLVTAGSLGQHLLVAPIERLFLRLVLLRGAYKSTLRAFKRGRRDLNVCGDAASDWTDVLDPAHVEAYRVILAGVAR